MSLLQQFGNINTFVFDIDGVLTDGTVLVLNDGLQARQMHVKDGLGLQMAINKGYDVLIISGGTSEESKMRLEKLGIKNVHLAVSNKTTFLQQYISDKDLKWENVLYMGDDLPDVALMKLVGLACCPADAVGEVKSACHYISPVNGGWGCVRDVIEKVLRINDHWVFENTIVSK